MVSFVEKFARCSGERTSRSTLALIEQCQSHRILAPALVRRRATTEQG